MLGVYKLAADLARAGKHTAADICLLCVHLLRGWNVFTVCVICYIKYSLYTLLVASRK